MTKNIGFSLIMPAYNSSSTVLNAIKSVILQKWKNFELIIVDDNSDLETQYIINKYKKNNNKISVYRMNINQGAPYCMNFAVSKTRFEWIGIIDSDAVMPPEWLIETASQIDNSIDIIGGKYVYFNTNRIHSYLLTSNLFLENSIFAKEEQIYNLNNYREPSIAGGNFFFKKTVFNKIGGFNTNFRAGYDRLFICDALKKGFTVKYSPNIYVNHPLYNYQSHWDIFSRSINFNKWRVQIIKHNELIARKYKIINYLLFTILITNFLVTLLFNLVFSMYITSILFFILSILLFFKILLLDKIQFKYLPGVYVIESINKIIGIWIYYLDLKPKHKDWKLR